MIIWRKDENTNLRSGWTNKAAISGISRTKRDENISTIVVAFVLLCAFVGDVYCLTRKDLWSFFSDIFKATISRFNYPCNFLIPIWRQIRSFVPKEVCNLRKRGSKWISNSLFLSPSLLGRRSILEAVNWRSNRRKFRS